MEPTARRSIRIGILLLAASGAACAGSSIRSRTVAPLRAIASVDPVIVPPAIHAVVNAPDRSAPDKELDAGRHPAETLAFFDVRPGMRVAEIGAARGYTTELLARAVAPSGVVFGQNSDFILKRFAEGPWSARLATPAMRNVVRVDREFDEPL